MALAAFQRLFGCSSWSEPRLCQRIQGELLMGQAMVQASAVQGRYRRVYLVLSPPHLRGLLVMAEVDLRTVAEFDGSQGD